MVKIIAEAGVNHNGQEELAFELVKAAQQAGADIVKFQTFSADALVTPTARQAQYQAQNCQSNQTQYQMLKQLELSHDCFRRLQRYAAQLQIGFLSTAFDDVSLRFLLDELALPLLKIPSGELTNGPFLLAHARAAKPIILSTGMATLTDIENALAMLAFGYTENATAIPTEAARMAALYSDAGRQALLQRVTLLHCTSDYPAKASDVHLRAMQTLQQAFGLPVGYSDHSLGLAIPAAATALGACVIEKHFTLDKQLPGPDHKASLEPAELAAMVQNIREVSQALGSTIKQPTAAELDTRLVARKSLVTSQAVAKGEVFSVANLAIKRPGHGISPMQYWDLLGQTANRDYHADEVIDG